MFIEQHQKELKRISYIVNSPYRWTVTFKEGGQECTFDLWRCFDVIFWHQGYAGLTELTFLQGLLYIFRSTHLHRNVLQKQKKSIHFIEMYESFQYSSFYLLRYSHYLMERHQSNQSPLFRFCENRHYCQNQIKAVLPLNMMALQQVS